MAQTSAAVELGNTQAYQDKLQNLLQGRDPLEVLAQTPDVIARLAAGQTPQAMRTRPFPGKWTPNEIVGHLTDTEWVFGFRARLILCEAEPAILGMDQDLWAAGQRHNEREPADLVEMFRMLRKFNLALWRRMTPRDLERAGRHNERGRETLGLMLRMEAGHDLSHIDQLTRYLQAVKDGAGA